MPPPDPFAQKLYPVLCLVLSDRATHVDWPAFTPDDWQALPALARREGVAPLLYAKFKAGDCPVQAPPSVMDALAAEYYRTAAQNTLLFSELERILAALDEAHIPVVVLKGAALAQTIYPDPALRPMGDLDLLVKRGQLEKAAHLLTRLGYRIIEAGHLGVAEWLNEVANHHHHLEGGPGGNVVVELHWNLVAGDADPRTPDSDWLWEQSANFSARANMPEMCCPALHLNDIVHLLYVAAHLMLQHRSRDRILIWYYDLHRLLSHAKEEDDWNALLEAARRLRWVDALRDALLETRERFRTPIQAGFLATLATHQDPAARRLMAYKTERTDSRTVDNWRNLATYRWPVRLKLAWALFFPRPAYLHYRYRPRPAWLWPFYYPYRWWDILSDVIKTLFRKAGKP